MSYYSEYSLTTHALRGIIYIELKKERGKVMNECVVCKKEINGEFFVGESGKICEKCLKEMQVYFALRSMKLIKEVKE